MDFLSSVECITKPLKAGYLQRKQPLGGGWKRNWTVLKNRRLLFFSKTATGLRSIVEVVAELRHDAYCRVAFVAEATTKRPHCFRLTDQSESKPILLAAESESECQQWCEAVLLEMTNEVPLAVLSEPRPADHLVFVIHGIGSQLLNDKLKRQVANLCKARDAVMQSALPDLEYAVEFAEVEWHSTLRSLDSCEEVIKGLTPKTFEKMRRFFNDKFLDVGFYMTPRYQKFLLDSVAAQLNKRYDAFCQKNPSFSGRVSILAHSLGSVISFDILIQQQWCQLPQPVRGHANADCELIFRPAHLFMLGSPLGVFLGLRGVTHIEAGLLGFQLHNIYHPNDVIAFRMEPMMDKRFSSVDPVELNHMDDIDRTLWRSTLKSVSRFFGSSSAQTSADPSSSSPPRSQDHSKGQSADLPIDLDIDLDDILEPNNLEKRGPNKTSTSPVPIPRRSPTPPPQPPSSTPPTHSTQAPPLSVPETPPTTRPGETRSASPALSSAAPATQSPAPSSLTGPSGVAAIATVTAPAEGPGGAAPGTAAATPTPTSGGVYGIAAGLKNTWTRVVQKASTAAAAASAFTAQAATAGQSTSASAAPALIDMDYDMIGLHAGSFNPLPVPVPPIHPSSRSNPPSPAQKQKRHRHGADETGKPRSAPPSDSEQPQESAKAAPEVVVDQSWLKTWKHPRVDVVLPNVSEDFHMLYNFLKSHTVYWSSKDVLLYVLMSLVTSDRQSELTP